MSHTTKISGIKIPNIAALESAIEELALKGIKITLTPDASPRSYYSGFGQEQEGMGKAAYVIGLADAKYDIGLYDDGNGGYEARTDFWAGSVEKVLGAQASAKEYQDQAKMGKLFQAYAVHATIATARMQGKSIRRVTQEDGTEQLIVAGF